MLIGHVYMRDSDAIGFPLYKENEKTYYYIANKSRYAVKLPYEFRNRTNLRIVLSKAISYDELRKEMSSNKFPEDYYINGTKFCNIDDIIAPFDLKV